MKYKKRPVEIEAVQWNPTERGSQIGGWPRKWGKTPKEWNVSCIDLTLFIPTLEGEMRCAKGDWVIKGIKGEFYSCKPDIFEKSYEKVQAKTV